MNISVAGRYSRRMEENPKLDWAEDTSPAAILDEGYDDDEDDDDFSGVGRGRRLIARKIPSNSLLLLTLTNIQTPASKRPTADNITYTITTKLGNPLEYYVTPLKF